MLIGFTKWRLLKFCCEWKYSATDRSCSTMRLRRCDFIHFCNDGGRLSGAPGHFEWTKPLRTGTNEWREPWRRKRKWRKVDCWLVEKLMGRVSGWVDAGVGNSKGSTVSFGRGVVIEWLRLNKFSRRLDLPAFAFLFKRRPF